VRGYQSWQILLLVAEVERVNLCIVSGRKILVFTFFDGNLFIKIKF